MHDHIVVTDEMIAAAWKIICDHKLELLYHPGAIVQAEIYRAMRALEPATKETTHG